MSMEKGMDKRTFCGGVSVVGGLVVEGEALVVGG